MPRLWTALTALTLALPALAGKKPARANILFITIETLRADHVGCYGYRRNTTPAIDQLAREGARFTQAIAASPWTMPSQMTMFTSVHPSEHQAIDYHHKLLAGLTTLAAELKKADYQTAGITSNPSCYGKFGFSRGFDHYDDFTVFLVTDLNVFEEHEKPLPFHQTITNKTVSRMALQWLKKKRDKTRPFFLHLFYFDPHYDYTPPQKYARLFTDPKYNGKQDGTGILELRGTTINKAEKQHIINLYDAEVRYTDDHIAKIIGELKKLRLYDDTIILVVADHGEEFWDHNSLAHDHTLYDELVQVPLVIRWPAKIKAGTVITEQVSHLDVMPTLLAMAGVPVPQQCRGQSLLPLLTGNKKGFVQGPAFLETEVEEKLRGIRTSTRKIVRDLETGALAFYYLRKDPKEQRNLAGTRKERSFQQLRKQFEAWEKAMQKAREKKTAKGKVDPKILKKLKALGYMH